VQGGSARDTTVAVADVDLVLLRNDPADDAVERPWAVTAGVAFGRLAAANGAVVLNDPDHLAHALSKAYFQHFPEAVRPATLVSRDEARIAEFVADLGGKAVLKPLQGSGGTSVFLVSEAEAPNLNQMIEAILRDGYVVAQEFLPAATEGDVRVFVMDGRPLEVDGTVAAFRRVNSSADLRSNMSVGGEARPVEVTDEMRHLVDLVRPKLVRDGMFLVGLDIVGDKLMEVNVFSPGGLESCRRLYDVDFTEVVAAELERKVEDGAARGGVRT
jgi:glutathione synthase